MTQDEFCADGGFVGRERIGFAINVHSDHVLANLRAPGETGYKIPQGASYSASAMRLGPACYSGWHFWWCAGGMFRFVSGANFFGEIVEWFGYVPREPKPESISVYGKQSAPSQRRFAQQLCTCLLVASWVGVRGLRLQQHRPARLPGTVWIHHVVAAVVSILMHTLTWWVLVTTQHHLWF
jgi:hypothetical protein